LFNASPVLKFGELFCSLGDFLHSKVAETNNFGNISEFALFTQDETWNSGDETCPNYLYFLIGMT
jgi:hypothetical protein